MSSPEEGQPTGWRGQADPPEVLCGEVVPRAPRKERARDPIWDALVDHLGYGPETKNERGRWNAAVKQLREAGATYEQVRLRAMHYQLRYPGAALTPTALVSHWGACSSPPSLLTRKVVQRAHDTLVHVAECRQVADRVGEDRYEQLRRMQQQFFGMTIYPDT